MIAAALRNRLAAAGFRIVGVPFDGDRRVTVQDIDGAYYTADLLQETVQRWGTEESAKPIVPVDPAESAPIESVTPPNTGGNAGRVLFAT